MAPEGRQLHLNPSSNPLIGNMIIKLAADHLPDGGEVALLSATTTSTNQNIWIEEMMAVMGNYPGIEVVATVYGDDLGKAGGTDGDADVGPVCCELGWELVVDTTQSEIFFKTSGSMSTLIAAYSSGIPVRAGWKR